MSEIQELEFNLRIAKAAAESAAKTHKLAIEMYDIARKASNDADFVLHVATTRLEDAKQAQEEA